VGPGLELAEAFYRQVVAPVVEPRVRPRDYAAGLMGPGSEVLGFDDARSSDHDFGPRVQVLLADEVDPDLVTALCDELDRLLPDTFGGRPVRFPTSHDPVIRHRVEVAPRAAWFADQLGFDPSAGITTEDWLATPTWRLRAVTAGRVFHDGPGELSGNRSALGWYPDDVWRWILAAQWRRIAEEEAFPGRCAEVGDELGATVLVGRLVREVMRLWLLMARAYPPYAKWLGTAFARLPGSNEVVAEAKRALAAAEWSVQERHLGAVLVATARRSNALGLAAECPATLRPFFDRPFLVIGGDRFAAALLEQVRDPALRTLPLTGVCDQFMDSVGALTEPRVVRGAVGGLLEPRSP
jgi:Domain of unknown function (DUF4037)